MLFYIRDTSFGTSLFTKTKQTNDDIQEINLDYDVVGSAVMLSVQHNVMSFCHTTLLHIEKKWRVIGEATLLWKQLSYCHATTIKLVDPTKRICYLVYVGICWVGVNQRSDVASVEGQHWTGASSNWFCIVRMQHHSSVSVDVTDGFCAVMDFMIDGCAFFKQG